MISVKRMMINEQPQVHEVSVLSYLLRQLKKDKNKSVRRGLRGYAWQKQYAETNIKIGVLNDPFSLYFKKVSL